MQYLIQKVIIYQVWYLIEKLIIYPREGEGERE